jgi:hypothetical protein
MKKTITIYDTTDHNIMPPSDGMDFIVWFKTLMDKVPEEYSHTAAVIFGTDGFDFDIYPTIKVVYSRPENELELYERELRNNRLQEAQEIQDKNKLAELKAKYE